MTECSRERGSRRTRAVAVVGIGRSGTSLVTRGLEALGVDLGGALRPGAGKNPTGFFEDEALAAISRRVRKAAGLRSVSVALVEPEVWRSDALRALVDEACAVIRARFGESALWGFKHGRTLQILPFWRQVFESLDVDDAYVVASRNPVSVARSRAVLNARRGEQAHSDLEWLVNVVPHMRLVLERPFVVVDYDRLVAAPATELERVAERLAFPVDAETRNSIQSFGREFVDPSLRHSHFGAAALAEDVDVNPLVREAYGCLHRLACDESGIPVGEVRAMWQRVEESMAALAPAIRRMGELELDLRRARNHPFGPLQNLPRMARKQVARIRALASGQ